jgi:hypothetical protein
MFWKALTDLNSHFKRYEQYLLQNRLGKWRYFNGSVYFVNVAQVVLNSYTWIEIFNEITFSKDSADIKRYRIFSLKVLPKNPVQLLSYMKQNSVTSIQRKSSSSSYCNLSLLLGKFVCSHLYCPDYQTFFLRHQIVKYYKSGASLKSFEDIHLKHNTSF